MFLPENYVEPTMSNYMKLVDGDNTFRVLSPAIVGYEYWKTITKDDGKEGRTPIRKRFDENIDLNDLETKEDGSLDMPKVFWAFVVYNFNDKRIQILEITQASIRKAIEPLIKNPKWGDPKEYNLVITKSGQKLDTEYHVSPEPKEKLDESIIKKAAEMKIDLEELYSGGDPFKNATQTIVEPNKAKEKAITANDEVNLDEIPF